MAVTADTVRKKADNYDAQMSMGILLRKLDEAIDDLENGRVQTIEDAWKEIDAVQEG